ncbi:hypothetical protein KCP75_14400 [Salmonella enterica subsp. enterica]|nr:hypothetical protein KCP75_14400 [Salmonella enterica subsp. enterica]
MVRVRVGATISQAMPGATMLALPVIGRIVLALLLWRLVDERAHRSRNIRCVREFFSLC